MPEYIDREKALKLLESAQAWGWSNNTLYDEMKDLPSADVAPIVHAKWIDLCMTETDRCGEVIREEKDVYFMCSNCECIYSKRHFCQRNFCARCGAKMDLEEDE